MPSGDDVGPGYLGDGLAGDLPLGGRRHTIVGNGLYKLFSGGQFAERQGGARGWIGDPAACHREAVRWDLPPLGRERGQRPARRGSGFAQLRRHGAGGEAAEGARIVGA